jgi:hypothetical protein
MGNIKITSPADDPEVESVKNDEKRHGDIVSALL